MDLATQCTLLMLGELRPDAAFVDGLLAQHDELVLTNLELYARAVTLIVSKPPRARTSSRSGRGGNNADTALRASTERVMEKLLGINLACFADGPEKAAIFAEMLCLVEASTRWHKTLVPAAHAFLLEHGPQVLQRVAEDLPGRDHLRLVRLLCLAVIRDPPPGAPRAPVALPEGLTDNEKRAVYEASITAEFFAACRGVREPVLAPLPKAPSVAPVRVDYLFMMSYARNTPVRLDDPGVLTALGDVLHSPAHDLLATTVAMVALALGIDRSELHPTWAFQFWTNTTSVHDMPEDAAFLSRHMEKTDAGGEAEASRFFVDALLYESAVLEDSPSYLLPGPPTAINEDRADESDDGAGQLHPAFESTPLLPTELSPIAFSEAVFRPVATLLERAALTMPTMVLVLQALFFVRVDPPPQVEDVRSYATAIRASPFVPAPVISLLRMLAARHSVYTEAVRDVLADFIDAPAPHERLPVALRWRPEEARGPKRVRAGLDNTAAMDPAAQAAAFLSELETLLGDVDPAAGPSPAARTRVVEAAAREAATSIGCAVNVATDLEGFANTAVPFLTCERVHRKYRCVAGTLLVAVQRRGAECRDCGANGPTDVLLGCRCCPDLVCLGCVEGSKAQFAPWSTTVGDWMDKYNDLDSSDRDAGDGTPVDPDVVAVVDSLGAALPTDALGLALDLAQRVHGVPVLHVSNRVGSSDCACGARAVHGPPPAKPSPALAHLLRHSDTVINSVHRTLEMISTVSASISRYGLRRIMPTFALQLDVVKPALPLLLRLGALRQQLAHTVPTVHAGANAGNNNANDNSPARRTRSITVARGDDLAVALRNASLLMSRYRVTVQYHGEAGFGEGPTLEFYSAVAAAASATGGMWARAGATANGRVPSAGGVDDAFFNVLGAVVARALCERCSLPVDLNDAAWRAILAPTPDVDTARELLLLSDPEKLRHLESLRQMPADTIEDLALTFPNADGTPSDIDVTSASLEAFIAASTAAAAAPLVSACRFIRDGMQCVLPVQVVSLWVVAEDMHELVTGRKRRGPNDPDSPKLFTREELARVVVAAQGYTQSCREIGWLIDVLAGMSPEDQANFAEFLCGARALPCGGIEGLGKPITVARKDFDCGPNTLPSCSTCFLYLKLPPYKSREVLEERVLVAVRAGRGHYALS